MNQLVIEVYDSSNNRIGDPRGEFSRAQGVRFSTGYPGGRYLDASVFVPADITDRFPIEQKQRIVLRNGQTAVYEGWVDGLDSILNETDQGVKVKLTGAWGMQAMRRYIRKNWADLRITEDVWEYITSASGANLCSVDRQARLRFVPKAEAWTNGNGAAVQYSMPTGETVKRLYYDYNLTEGAQAWEIGAYRSTDGINWTLISEANGDTISGAGTTTQITASGTGNIDVTLGTESQYVRLLFYARANQTPTSDATYFGEFTDVRVFSETSNINLTEIATDIVGLNTNINSDTARINSNTLALVPFIIDRWTSIADVLTQAAEFGDSSFNRWSTGFVLSELAATPNGEPALSVAQYPALTDYDYAIRLDDPNVIAPIEIERDFSRIYNWIVVEWYDEEGHYNVYTPDDDANLKDTTSIAAYYQRDYVINVGSSTQTSAVNSGRRFLAAYKDPQYTVNGPIGIKGYIRKKDGSRLPCSQIQAGYRVKIENYLEDLSGTGLTFLISYTDYEDDAQVCSISIGPPSDLIFPRFVFKDKPPADLPIDAAGGTDSGAGGNAENLNWKRKVGLTPGTPGWDEAVRIGKKAWYAKYRNKTIW